MSGIEAEEFVEKLVEKYQNINHIFRGSTKPHENGINSALYRKYLNFKDFRDVWSSSNPTTVEKEIVERARERLQEYKDSTLTQILTDLRHYGDTVNIIDFTTNVYKALFFACHDESGEDGNKAGELAILERYKFFHTSEIEYVAKSNNGESKNNISPWSKSIVIINPAITKISYQRVLNQNSIFVCSASGFIGKNLCNTQSIPSSYKEGILEYLKSEYKISKNSIYNEQNNIDSDLPSFIASDQNHRSSVIAFNQGLTHGSVSKIKKPVEAIKFYTKAIEYDPNFFKAYINRAIDHAAMGNYEEAREDCNTAIELGVNSEDIYMVRGIANHKLGKYNCAINDFNKALELYQKSRDLIDQQSRDLIYQELGSLLCPQLRYFTHRPLADLTHQELLDLICQQRRYLIFRPHGGLKGQQLGDSIYQQLVGSVHRPLEDLIYQQLGYLVYRPQGDFAHQQLVGLIHQQLVDLIYQQCGDFVYQQRGGLTYRKRAQIYGDRGAANHEIGKYKEAIEDFGEGLMLHPGSALEFKRLIDKSRYELNKMTHNNPSQ